MRRRGFRSERRFFAAGLALGVVACGSLPGWIEADSEDSPRVEGPVSYPDLAEIPGRPGTAPAEADRVPVINSLAAARAANERAAQDLEREVETEFEFPSHPN